MNKATETWHQLARKLSEYGRAVAEAAQARSALCPASGPCGEVTVEMRRIRLGARCEPADIVVFHNVCQPVRELLDMAFCEAGVQFRRGGESGARGTPLYDFQKDIGDLAASRDPADYPVARFDADERLDRVEARVNSLLELARHTPGLALDHVTPRRAGISAREREIAALRQRVLNLITDCLPDAQATQRERAELIAWLAGTLGVAASVLAQGTHQPASRVA